MTASHLTTHRKDQDPRPALRFAFWTVRPDIVLDNLERYARTSGESLEPMPIGGSYERALASAWSSGRGPHAFYAQRAEAAKWAAEGRIEPLPEDDLCLRSTLSRMDPRLVAGARDSQGRLLGLTYYNAGPFALVLNQDLVPPAEVPSIQGWSDVLALCRSLKRSGASAFPFLPRWHATQTGLAWSFLCHLASEGVLDPDHADRRRATTELIRVWQAFIDERLVPPDSLQDQGDAPAVLRWRTRTHALAFTMDYLLADFAEDGGQPFSIPAPRLPGRTGTPLLPGQALLCVAAGLSSGLASRALGLVRTLGGEDYEGELFVHRRWISECLFPVPFPELYRDAGVRASARRFFRRVGASQVVDRLFAARLKAVPSPMTHVPWALAWSENLDTIIRQDVLTSRRETPGAAAEAIWRLWDELARTWADSHPAPRG
jgi:hypothetical protein